MRHMPDVFVVTPSGSLLAPNVVELQLNSDDLAALCERMELGVICTSLTEVYEEQVAAYGARFARPSRPDVLRHGRRLVPPGRYRLRQGDAVNAGGSPTPDAAQPVFRQPRYPGRPVRGRRTRAGLRRAAGGLCRDQHAGLVRRPDPRPGPGSDHRHQRDDHGHGTRDPRRPAAAPGHRLSVAETRMSGAARRPRVRRAGAAPRCRPCHGSTPRSLSPTASWRITNLGRNGLTLNGAPVTGEQPLSDGDAIRWGARPDALLSRVEIS